jgi:hypothetical protein
MGTSSRRRDRSQGPTLKILVVLYHPGHLRFFDSTLRELAARGHSVEITFDRADKGSAGLRALESMGERVVVLGETPVRRDRFAPVADSVRRVADYLRFLHPAFRDAGPLRKRREKYLPASFRFTIRLPTLARGPARALIRTLLALERAIPSSAEIEAFVAARAPDLVVVSPLVTHHSARQTDVVKSARALGIPTVLSVGSWDHLTTKGLVREHPDRVLVWNQAQVAEASELHLVPSDRLRATGAQPFDIWFGREPSVDRGEFCRRVGLPPERPFVLFVGSSPSIAQHEREVAFVRRWIGALRASGRAVAREAGVLIRPHPLNMASWPNAELGDLGPVAVWPRRPADEFDQADRAEYFDSIHHSAGVVGVNTSAMIHFRHLLPENGGFVLASDDIDEHLDSLAEVLESPAEAKAVTDRFVASFIRPRGIDRPSTPMVADELEAAARLVPGAPKRSGATRLSRLALEGCVLALTRSGGGRAWRARTSASRYRRARKAVRRARRRARRSVAGRARRAQRTGVNSP